MLEAHDIDIVGLIAIVGAGTFIRSYCAELGKRFGGTTADWLAKIHVHRKSGNESDLEVPVDGLTTTFEITGEMPDQATLALIELT